MKIKIDKKRTILSVATILAFITIPLKEFPATEIVLQIMELIGSISSRQKDSFYMLKDKIGKEINKLFPYLQYEHCEAIVRECFSIDCIEQYLAADKEINLLAEKLRNCIINQTQEESDNYDMDYIFYKENYIEKADVLINRINTIISTNDTLKSFEHRIIGEQTLAEVRSIDDKLSIILTQVAMPNSAYLWNTPRQKNVNREILRLHYTAGNVQLYDREEELDLLMNFCGYNRNSEEDDTIPNFQWWMVTGEGGTGKSRMIYEFSKMMETRGWTVCYPYSNKRNALDQCSEMLPNDTLFVIDYTEMDLADIGGWLNSFGANKYSDIFVRVILIQRIAENIDSLNIYRDAQERAYLYRHVYNNGLFLKLKTISDDSLKRLIIEYGNSKISESVCDELFMVLSDLDKLKRPLFAIAIADAYMDGIWINKKTELLDHLCNKEEDGIKDIIYRHFEYRGDELLQHLCSIAQNIVTMATIVGGLSLDSMLEKLLPQEYAFLQGLYYDDRIRFLRDSELFYVNSNEIICDPIEPDIIGEYYVIKNIKHREDMLCRAWGDPYHMSRFVTRLYQDFEEQISGIKEYLDSPQLPDFVEKIDDFAFSGCESLLSIKIPESVKKIGRSAFKGCRKLKTVEISDSIIELGDCVFEECINMKEVKIPKTISKIPTFAFRMCLSLNTVDIPDSVVEIGEGAFIDCINLRLVRFEGQSSVRLIGRAAFSSCIRLKKITIPSRVEIINDSLFANCAALEEVQMSDEIHLIAECAFQGCFALKQIRLSNKLKRIEELAFAQCTNLELIEFSNNTVQIDEGAFFYNTNPNLIRILKDYCQNSIIDFESLYLRKGVYDYLFEYNLDLYNLQMRGAMLLEVDEKRSMAELKAVCENLKFKVTVWEAFFILSECE